jgi:hypothetical protein
MKARRETLTHAGMLKWVAAAEGSRKGGEGQVWGGGGDRWHVMTERTNHWQTEAQANQ